MDIQTIANDAIVIAKRRYGAGWEHISNDARIGATVIVVITNFNTFVPNAKASEVHAAVMAVVEAVVSES